MVNQVEDPPPGFRIKESGDGRWTVRHTPPDVIGRGGLAWWAKLLSGMTALLIGVGAAAFAMGGVLTYIALALVGSTLVFLVLLFVLLLWTVSSVTAFTFGPDEMVVERSSRVLRRRRKFRQGDVRSVAQVQEGDAPFWTLEVAGDSRVKVLPYQTMENSRWLGSRVAQWAGVPFETFKREKPEPMDWL